MSERTRILPMKSPAGWYLGEEYWNREIGHWLPNDRLSGYHYSKWEVVLLRESRMTGVEVISAIKEIEVELVRSRANKHMLAPARTQFLEHALAAFREDELPVWRWNYSLNATPDNAIIGRD